MSEMYVCLFSSLEISSPQGWDEGKIDRSPDGTMSLFLETWTITLSHKVPVKFP